MSELFTFLVCLLRCPALPLSEALFHGGKGEAGDSRISTERALFLALPDEEKDPREILCWSYILRCNGFSVSTWYNTGLICRRHGGVVLLILLCAVNHTLHTLSWSLALIFHH